MVNLNSADARQAEINQLLPEARKLMGSEILIWLMQLSMVVQNVLGQGQMPLRMSRTSSWYSTGSGYGFATSGSPWSG